MFILRVFAALAVLLTCASAVAQVVPELTPPLAQSSTDVPYPPGAEGDAAVVLELIVEKDGSVSSATAVEGTEPFAEQARTAALTWRFTPAQRDHTPVAARIRARVAFHQDPEEPPTPPAPPLDAPAPQTLAQTTAHPHPRQWKSRWSAHAAKSAKPPCRRATCDKCPAHSAMPSARSKRYRA